VRVNKVVDLSIPLDRRTPVYPGDPVPRVDVHATIESAGVNLLSLALGSQTGTHADAPFHTSAGGARIDELDLRLFVGPAVVVDAGDAAPRDRLGRQRLAPVRDRLGPGAVVLVRTGWEQGQGGPARVDHPYLGVDLAEELVAAGVRTVGIDALSVDETPDAGQPVVALPVHHVLDAVGAVILENLTGWRRCRAWSSR
jgi:kynurenine formamidase